MNEQFQQLNYNILKPKFFLKNKKVKGKRAELSRYLP